MSKKKRILVIQKVHEKGMELIKNHPNFEVDVTDDTSEENLKKKIQNCDGVSIRIANLSGNVMDQAKNLKIVSRHGVGYDNIDLKYAKDKDIKIAIHASWRPIRRIKVLVFCKMLKKNSNDLIVKFTTQVILII